MLKKTTTQLLGCKIPYSKTYSTRNFLLIFVLLSACIIFTGCSKKNSDSSPKEPSAKTSVPVVETEQTNKKTDSASDQKQFGPPPDKDTVLSIRSAALAGIDGHDTRRLITVISNANLRLERLLIFGDLQDLLSDPDSDYWNYLEQTGEIITGYAYETEDLEKKDSLGLTEEEFQQQYGEPVYAQNDYDAEAILKILGELQESIYNEAFRQDFVTLSKLVQKAKDTHDVKCVINIYRILHDMDYYLLRYGPENVGKYVQDKSTILRFYGVLEDYRQTEYYHEDGFLS